MIEIDDIDMLPFSSITDDELARTGEADLETLRRRAAHAGPIHDDTFLYRVEFHVVRQLDNMSPLPGSPVQRNGVRHTWRATAFSTPGPRRRPPTRAAPRR